MGVLHLSEDQVRHLLDMKTALDAVEEGFASLAAGQAKNVPRERVHAPGITLHTMSASAAYLGLVGWKNYTTTSQGAQFWVGLHSQESGQLVALIQADHLGRLRTGAATGVAASWMAHREASSLGIFGTGRQAETQLEALCLVRNIKQAYVYSRNPQKRLDFCQRMADRLGTTFIPVDRPQEAVEGLPIVVTATTSNEPVFHGDWLAEGAFVAAVGSNALNRAELDFVTVRRADTVVCDSVMACRKEAGDFVDALQRGYFDWSKAVDLASVVAGTASSRFQPESISIFKSVGLALEDVALAGQLFRIAKLRGVGTQIEL